MRIRPISRAALVRRLALVAAVGVAVGVAVGAAPTLAAQQPVNASLGWKTIRTEHFRIHYEPGLEVWSQSLAARIEQMREIVAARVGHAPSAVVDIIVEDPINQPNGSAWPSLPMPSMRFWATPPDPNSVIGHLTDWGGLLGIHEFAHIAHLTRPSRAVGARLLWQLSPVPLGPVAVKSPAWVTEGYATLIEGELTGSGRPNGAARPAVIRQLALEGALPSYEMLDSPAPFMGGTMRYLVGSAYLEWLQAQRGDSSLVHLWRRMTAKQDRTFDVAFAGVFGETPRVLYGRFVAEVTAQAAQARNALAAQGLAQGGLRQHLRWSVGAPALSSDGTKVAIRLASPGQPTRVLVLETKVATPDSALLRLRERLLKRDPLDVMPVDAYPWPLKQVATLGPLAGVGFDAPRWIRGSDDLLVLRSTPLSDGRARSDVYRWNSATGALKRVTTGAGVREVDPLPDGTRAVGVRCGAGTCGLVLIDLRAGALRDLYRGSVTQPLAGARVSPDGRRVATAIARAGLWRLAVVDVASGALTEVGPRDEQSRWAPTWDGDSALLAVSDASGAPNIERLRLGSGETQQVTRVTGAASAPDRAPDGRVWFLDLHARGHDLRAIAPDSIAAPAAARALVATLAPVAPRRDTSKAVPLVPREVPAARGYGVGRLAVRPFYPTQSSTEGSVSGFALQVNDPLGRVSALGQYTAGRGGLMHGGALGIAWRGTRPELRLSGFYTTQSPSEQWGDAPLGSREFDRRYVGSALLMELPRRTLHGSTRTTLGASIGRLEPVEGQGSATGASRQLVATGFAARYLWTPLAALRLGHEVDLDYATGLTAGYGWQRVVGRVAYSIAGPSGRGVQVEGTYGVIDEDAPLDERFVVGGAPAALIEPLVMSHRLARPGLPFALATGRSMASIRTGTTGPVRVYHEWLGAGTEPSVPLRRVAGVASDFAVPPLAALRVPAIHVSLGALYSFDGPWAKQVGGHLSVIISP